MLFCMPATRHMIASLRRSSNSSGDILRLSVSSVMACISSLQSQDFVVVVGRANMLSCSIFGQRKNKDQRGRDMSALKLNFISHATLETSDIEKSRKFYEEFLGLEVIEMSPV